MAPDPREPKISPDVLIEALQKLPPEVLTSLLQRTGTLPTTVGMTPEQFQTILHTAGAVNAKAMQQMLRRENPFYPERSVFNPAGKFDDDGTQLPPKVTFTRDSYFCGVMLGRAGATGELNTPEEIALFNRFTSDREARDGEWKAEITKVGNREVIKVTVPHRTTDERMGLPPMDHILMELLEGAEAIRPDHLLKQVAELKARVALLESAPTVAA